MIQIATAHLWVHDQDVAKAFYLDKLGWELREDNTVAEMGNFRWLTVAPPKQEISVALLAVPGPPMFDPETTAQVSALMAKGKAGTLFLTTEDLPGDYERLSAAGVDFYQAPTQMPYGFDSGFRDPSGNMFRLSQLGPVPQPA